MTAIFVIAGFCIGFLLGTKANPPLMLCTKRSLKVNGKVYVAEKSYVMGGVKIWSLEYPEYYLLHSTGSADVWSICSDKKDSAIHGLYDVLRTVCVHSTRDAVRSLEEFIFDEKIEPSLSESDALLNQYIRQDNS